MVTRLQGVEQRREVHVSLASDVVANGHVRVEVPRGELGEAPWNAALVSPAQQVVHGQLRSNAAISRVDPAEVDGGELVVPLQLHVDHVHGDDGAIRRRQRLRQFQPLHVAWRQAHYLIEQANG